MTPALAQIRPDTTLADNSVVRAEGTTNWITGGTQVGTNLFHSFQQFDLSTATIAHFKQQPSISNIFARITGSRMSILDGVIQANGSANLFLINPSGILFGANAQLNLGGSFLATTANSVLFPDGKVFSSTPLAQSLPLLSINQPLGLAFNDKTSSITVKSQSGLEVKPGKALSLLGGEVNVGGNLTAPNGRIELGGVDANQQVQFHTFGDRRQLSYDNIQFFKDIHIDNLAIIDTSGVGGGDIHVQGRHITFANGGSLRAITLGDIDGGTISVNASNSLNLLGNRLRQSPIDPRFALIGFSLPQKTTIYSTTSGTGRSNDIKIDTGILQVTNGADISAVTDGKGDGGNLTIHATQFIEVGGETIVLNLDPQKIPFNEPTTRDVLIDQTSVSQISARSAFIPNSGASGDIKIKTRDLMLRDGANITAGSIVGRGGSITINATGIVEIVGSTQSGQSTSNLVTASTSDNNALNTVLQAHKLILREGGVITASTFGAGQGGTIEITTTESVEIVGVSRSGRFASQINSGTFGIGNSGDIKLKTGILKVQNGGLIELSSDSQGQTGSLSLLANSVLLDKQGQIRSNAVASPAGNINIATDLLMLRNGSNITTNASGIEDGGNININADLLVALPLEGNSNITANALNGSGGRISITTQGIFGIAVRARDTQLNDITAISQNNPQLNGVVSLNAPEADPSENLAEQPEVVEVSPPISQGCKSETLSNQSRFTYVGRGGLPTNPHDVLANPDLWQDLRSNPLQLIEEADSTSKKQFVPMKVSSAAKTIVEAQGWAQDVQGRIILKANQYSSSDERSWQPPFNC